MRTQHEMKCIGNGVPPHTELVYAVTYVNQRIIGSMKAYYRAFSEEDARAKFVFDRPGNTVVRVELL